MANTFDYLRRLWGRILPDTNHPVAPFFILLLVFIPTAYAFGNVALMLFAAACLYQFRKHRFFRIEWQLFLPIGMFALMAVSVTWSVNPSRSADSLAKELPLFAIPVCCMLMPVFPRTTKTILLEKYAYGMAVLGCFYMIRALYRYFLTGNSGVFFYHELVSKDVNAIHVSVYMAIAFFALLSKNRKNEADWGCLSLLGILLLLLSSKNIMAVFGFLLLVYVAFFSGFSIKTKALVFLGLFAAAGMSLVLFPKISERFRIEYDTVFTSGTINHELSDGGHKVYNVSLPQAWQKETFQDSDFFPGTAFRVYQVRIFCEMLAEDPIFFTGYGMNASNAKIKEKAIEHRLWLGTGDEVGYQGKNFHNQYVQNFADLGIFGLLLLLAMVVLNLKNGICAKDFTHISFAVLMISLFLTESFLWRQRGVMFFTSMYCLFNMGAGAFAASKKE